MHPVVEQLGDLRGAAGPEDGAQVLLELPRPHQPRAGPPLERLELGPLAVGEVLRVLHERVAAALDGGGLVLEGLDLVGRQLALGRPAALALGPGLGGLGSGPGGVPLLAAHVVERVVHPLDHVERVHDPPRFGATALDQLPYPPGAVGGHHLYGAPLLTRDNQCLGATKLVVFSNMVEDSPFMAGAVHGGGEADCVIHVGVSGPGVMHAALQELPQTASISEVAEVIKQTAFKITRTGELMSREAAKRLGAVKGIVDLSLAPTPQAGDSVAQILETIGVGQCGGPGTTCALALLNDAVKKGGVMASSFVGGLSGAFIPVSEDAGMIKAAQTGALSIEKLEAMTCVCSVGLDMIAVPGDTSTEAIAGLIADEMAIGVINNKTTAVRVIPALGKKVGDMLEFGGLFGSAPVMKLNTFAGNVFAHRKGQFPAPLNSLKN